MRRVYFAVLVLFLIVGCARVVNQTPTLPIKGESYAVLPFENYTETPYAGYRVASILEGVLASKGYNLIPRVWSLTERELAGEEIEKLKESAVKNGARYIVYGSVNEFRYKTGLDGEPAVSITVFVYDAKENKVVKNVAVSGSGWVHESLGTLAQKLLNRAF
jgi:TolB-like protein